MTKLGNLVVGKKNKITITFDGGGKLILMSKMGTDKTGHNKAEIYIW